MNLGDIQALWYITHIKNLTSILEVGILCHNEARKLAHVRVDNREVNARRDLRLPNGWSLHDYANLYLNPRNAMMMACALAEKGSAHLDLALLGVDKAVLQLDHVLVADMNAAVSGARIAPWREILPDLVRDQVFTRDWRDADEKEKRLKKARAMAEVLVPTKVPAEYIIEVSASCHYSHDRIRKSIDGSSVPTKVRHDSFWQPSPGPVIQRLR